MRPQLREGFQGRKPQWTGTHLGWGRKESSEHSFRNGTWEGRTLRPCLHPGNQSRARGGGKEAPPRGARKEAGTASVTGLGVEIRRAGRGAGPWKLSARQAKAGQFWWLSIRNKKMGMGSFKKCLVVKRRLFKGEPYSLPPPHPFMYA